MLKKIIVKINLFLVNKLFCGTRFFGIKRKLLKNCGFVIGKNTKVVGPLRVTGDLIIGENCWIGTGFTVHGNGSVTIGSDCDIAPDVVFLTGSHEIGDSGRRAGKGKKFDIVIGNSSWVGARSTFCENIAIGNSCIIGACSFVNKNFSTDTFIAGAPAKDKRKLDK